MLIPIISTLRGNIYRRFSLNPQTVLNHMIQNSNYFLVFFPDQLSVYQDKLQECSINIPISVYIISPWCNSLSIIRLPQLLFSGLSRMPWLLRLWPSWAVCLPSLVTQSLKHAVLKHYSQGLHFLEKRLYLTQSWRAQKLCCVPKVNGTHALLLNIDNLLVWALLMYEAFSVAILEPLNQLLSLIVPS